MDVAIPRTHRYRGQMRRRLEIWIEIAGERRARHRAEAALRRLSDHALKDLGIDRSEIASVARATDRSERRRYRGW